jgi:hypothetical protein
MKKRSRSPQKENENPNKLLKKSISIDDLPAEIVCQIASSLPEIEEKDTDLRHFVSLFRHYTHHSVLILLQMLANKFLYDSSQQVLLSKKYRNLKVKTEDDQSWLEFEGHPEYLQYVKNLHLITSKHEDPIKIERLDIILQQMKNIEELQLDAVGISSALLRSLRCRSVKKLNIERISSVKAATIGE